MSATKNFLSSGKKGDLHFQLYIVKALGGGNLYITEGEFEEPLESVLESCGELVRAQTYVQKFDVHRGESIDVDLDAFRRSPYLYRKPLLEVLCHAHGLDLPPIVEGWIDVPADPRFADKIVIHRRTTVVKERKNDLFDWNKLLRIFGAENCVFVSRLESEWHDFGHPEVKYYSPKNNYEHAQVIRACRFFLGNTCFGTALAEALGVNRITEVSYGLDRKHFAVNYASNAWYFASPWDYTLKNFQYLQGNKEKIDLQTSLPVQRCEPYHFNLRRAVAQEWHYRREYHSFLFKRFFKQAFRQL